MHVTPFLMQFSFSPNPFFIFQGYLYIMQNSKYFAVCLKVGVGVWGVTIVFCIIYTILPYTIYYIDIFKRYYYRAALGLQMMIGIMIMIFQKNKAWGRVGWVKKNGFLQTLCILPSRMILVL